METKTEHPTDREFTAIIGKITGYVYTFAVASSRHWDNEHTHHKSDLGFYQLMPEGRDGGFFDWYCVHRMYNQFFKSKSDCAMQFLNHYMKWMESGKPKPFDKE